MRQISKPFWENRADTNSRVSFQDLTHSAIAIWPDPQRSHCHLCSKVKTKCPVCHELILLLPVLDGIGLLSCLRAEEGTTGCRCSLPIRRFQLRCSITRSTGWLSFRRKISRSFSSSAAHFFSLGVYCGRHRLCKLQTRRNWNPRNPKLPSSS